MKQEEPEIQDFSRFSNEFNEESDRGAVLIAASRLDEILKSLLIGFLRETKSASDLVEGFHAPLGTFAARASACHALGLVDDAEFADITRIRKIRNIFGHHWKDIGFHRPEVADVARGLPWRGPAEYEETSNPRARFNAAVMLLITDLLWRQPGRAAAWRRPVRLTSRTGRCHARGTVRSTSSRACLRIALPTP